MITRGVIAQVVTSSTSVCGGTTTETMLGYASSTSQTKQNTNGIKRPMRCNNGCYVIRINIAYTGRLDQISITCSDNVVYGPVGWSGCCKNDYGGAFFSSAGFSGADVYFGSDVNALSIWNYGAKSGTILGCGGKSCGARFSYQCGSVMTGIEFYQQAGSDNWIQAFQPICGDITCTDTAYPKDGVCVLYPACNAGDFYTPPGQCSQCPVGQKSDGGYSRGCTDCLPIQSGVKFNTAGKCDTTTCDAGTYSGSTPSITCAKCWPNSNSASGASTCTCNAGYYDTVNSCTICPAGSKCSGGTSKDSCDPGYYSPTGASVCGVCPAGTYSVSAASSACSDCTAGTYSSVSGSKICGVCDFGTYASKSRSTVCNQCSTGSYTIAKGATVCLQCSPGSYSASTLDTACKACSAGYYASQPTATVCTTCAAGSFSSTALAVSCTSCLPGTYSKDSAATTCVACGTGTTQSSFGMYYCSACGPGTFTSDGVNCGQCNPGTYSESSKSAACTKCSKGQYSTGNGMTDASACVSCESGTYGSLMGMTSCLKCPAGTMGSISGAVDISWCQECMAGFNFAESPGMKKCTLCTILQCKLGQGLTPCDIATDARCYDCPTIDNCQYTRANVCSNYNIPACYCKAGYELVNGKCKLCADGMFKANADDSKCIFWTVTSCPSLNQYLANGTAYNDAQCIPCPKLPDNTETSPLERCGWKCKPGFER